MLQMYLAVIDTAEERSKFEELYQTYERLMHYLAVQILKDDRLAEEAVQEAFMRVAKNFSKINEIHCPKTRNFLVIIVKNVSLTMWNKEHDMQNVVSIEASTEETGIEFCIDDKADWNESASAKGVVHTILNLPETYRNVLYLWGVYGYTPKEIANLLNMNVDTVRKRIQRGKELLEKQLKEDL